MSIGEDGYPVPEESRKNPERFFCMCMVCLDANANLSISKNKNWLIRCTSCNSITYLNSKTSRNLFRGFQKVFTENQQYREDHISNIVLNTPEEGK